MNNLSFFEKHVTKGERKKYGFGFLDENAKPLQPAYIGCVQCDPFFLGFNKKGNVFYIV